MKKFAVLPAVALLAFATACENASNPLAAPQDGPSRELVDIGARILSGNAQVNATFQVTVSGGTTIRTSGPGINDEGKEIGLCTAGGRWQNPSTKKFSASVPHSNCVTVAPSMILSLEPITANYKAHENTNKHGTHTVEHVHLSTEETDYKVHWNSSPNQAGRLIGQGIIVAHAVDQNMVQRGTFTFDLNQYSGTTNYFGEYEDMTEEGGVMVFGLSKVIEAVYTAPDGTTAVATGTLYWSK